jgi:NapH/MauN family ferredoxin-type protein
MKIRRLMLVKEQTSENTGRAQVVRLALLAAVLIFMTWLGYRHQLLGGGPAGAPPVDALCPFGGLESLYSWLKDGSLLRRIAPSSLILFVGALLVTLLGGRLFCGWLCPMGALSEFVSVAARKLGVRQMTLSAPADRAARLVKYFVLAAVLALTWKFGFLAFRGVDPWAAWAHLSALGSGELSLGFFVLLAVLVAGHFVERFWCRYLCPLGAALALVSRFSLLKVRRSESKCLACGKCARNCPMGLTCDKAAVHKNGECIVCGRCGSVCPASGAIGASAAKRPVSFLAAGLAGVLLFAVAIAGAKGFGVWKTFAEPRGAAAGAYSADNIFGWMNVEQVAQATGLSAKSVLEAAGLPADTPRDVSIKKLPGVNDEELREKIRKYMENRPQGAAKNPQEIRGSATFGEICRDYQIEPQALFEALDLDAKTGLETPVKEIMKPTGREVQEVRDKVAELMKKK